MCFRCVLVFIVISISLLGTGTGNATMIGIEKVNNTYLHTWNNGTIEPEIWFNLSTNLEQFANALDRFDWATYRYGIGYIENNQFTELVNNHQITNTLHWNTDNETYWTASSQFYYSAGQRRFYAGFNNSQLLNDDYMKRTAYIIPDSDFSFNEDLYFFWEFTDININGSGNYTMINYPKGIINGSSASFNFVIINQTTDILEEIPQGQILIFSPEGKPYITIWSNETDTEYIFYDSSERKLYLLRDIPDSYTAGQKIERTFYWIDAVKRSACSCAGTMYAQGIFEAPPLSGNFYFGNFTYCTDTNFTAIGYWYAVASPPCTAPCQLFWDSVPVTTYTEATPTYASAFYNPHWKVTDSSGIGYNLTANPNFLNYKNFTIGGTADGYLSHHTRLRISLGANDANAYYNVTQIDCEAPTIQAIRPANNTIITNSSVYPISIECLAHDNTQVRSLDLYTNFSGTWEVNKSVNYNRLITWYDVGWNFTANNLTENRTFGWYCNVSDSNWSAPTVTYTGVYNIITTIIAAIIPEDLGYEFAIVVGLMFNLFCLIFLAMKLDDKQYPLKIFLTVMSIFVFASTIVISSIIAGLESAAAESILNAVGSGFIIVTIVYVGYYVIDVFEKMIKRVGDTYGKK